MDDGASVRRKTAEISSTLSPKTDRHVMNSMSTGWTDEKHCTFLNSIEASFVDQLYTNQYLSKDLPGWLSRWKKRVQSSGSDQCKIMHRECLDSQNLVSETAKTQKDMKIDSVPLSSSPWIRRLISIPAGNEANSKSSSIINGNVFPSQIRQGQSHKYYEATCLEKLPSVCQICPQDSVASIREVSDQNFVGDELDTGESRICKKRRLKRKSPDLVPVTDQIVPSKDAPLAPNFNLDHAYPNRENAESSLRTLQQTTSVLDKCD